MKIAAAMRQLEVRNRRLAAEAVRRAREALGRQADDFADAFEEVAPVDTGRFKRSYQEAAIQAGGRPRMVEPLRAGGNEVVVNRLKEQMEGLAGAIVRAERRIDTWYPPGRPKPTTVRSWYQRELGRVRMLRKRYERARVQYMRAAGAAAFDASTPLIVIGQGAGRRLRTVRTVYYGGVGRVVARGGLVSLSLRSREPHAKIVNSRSKALAKAGLVADRSAAMRLRRALAVTR